MSIRLALIGNMNNSNFALMRHLRDLGVDAHLLMYSSEAEHFRPQNDTWLWEKWRPYVRQLKISNGGLDAIFSRSSMLAAELEGFDFYIGNGISPVLFKRMGKSLDLFIPYGEGVEFIIEHQTKWNRPLSTGFSLLRKYLMEVALRRAVIRVVTANLHPHSLGTYSRLKLRPINMPILALYEEPHPTPMVFEAPIEKLIERLRSSNFVILSHVSHIWKNLPVPHFMGGVGKRNNWLVLGFAEYLNKTSNSSALLCLFNYGVDVPETKRLIAELGISRQVVWFPKMSRREIMCLLQYVDIGGSEFAGMYWGGCGWEFLASGTPMLHQLCGEENYESAEFPLPPFFNVHSPGDICRVLLANNRASLREVGEQARQWFKRYNGQSLAKRYVDLIKELHH